MPRLDSEPYTDLRRSLMQMPPANCGRRQPVQHGCRPPHTFARGSRDSSGLFDERGESNRRAHKCLSSSEREVSGSKPEGRSSSNYGSFFVESGTSEQGNDHPLRPLPGLDPYHPSVASSGEVGEYGNHQLIDADVRRGHSTHGRTLDLDDAHPHEGRVRDPFGQRPRTLPTWQQHLAERRGNLRTPMLKAATLESGRWTQSPPDGARAMEHDSCRKPPRLHESSFPSRLTMKPSERYAERKHSIDDTARRARRRGLDAASTSGSRDTPPDWLEGALGAPEKVVDPQVLRELVVVAVGHGKCGSGNIEGRELQSSNDTVARSRREHVSYVDDGSQREHVALGHLESPIQTKQRRVVHSKKWPSAIAQDARGPIPPACGILGSVFHSQVSTVGEGAPHEYIIHRTLSEESHQTGRRLRSIRNIEKGDEAPEERTCHNNRRSVYNDANKGGNMPSMSRNDGEGIGNMSYRTKSDRDPSHVSEASRGCHSDRKPPPKLIVAIGGTTLHK